MGCRLAFYYARHIVLEMKSAAEAEKLRNPQERIEFN